MRSKSIIVMAILLTATFCQAGTVIVDPNGSADHTTIQAAITASSNYDTIIVRQGIYVENINMLGKAITLRSTAPTDPNIVLVTIIDGGGSGSVITCSSGEDPNTFIDGFLIRNGTGTNDGYGIYYGGGMYNSYSSPTVSNCVFSGNAAFGLGSGGGGMCNWYSSPTVTNCTFSGNTAAVGGGMYCYGSSPTINNCVFIENTGYSGGGINLKDFNNLVLTNCTFINNTATGRTGEGGGVSAFRSSLTLTDCRFTGNSADNRRGGGFYIRFCDATVSNCTFSGNTANEGGGVYIVSSSSTLSNCTFSSNVAYGIREPCDGSVGGCGAVVGGGGGMNNENSSPDVVNCTFSGNTVYGYRGGGGMCNWNYSSPVVSNCTFSGNWSDRWGGGMYNFDHSSPMINNSTFSGNTADLIHGGGMYNRKFSSPTLKNCTFSGNTAAQYGGGMYTYDISSPEVISCTFSGNTAEYGGGIFNGMFSSLTIVNSIFWGNTAIEFNEIYGGYSIPPVISYSDIAGCGGSGGSWDTSLGTDGGDNIDADPQFIDPNGTDGTIGTEDDNLRLSAGSPCIDAADGDAAPATDLDGRDRYDDPYTANAGVGDPNYVDMGAYEFVFNTAPVADAGEDMVVSVGADCLASVTLDGSDSTDPDGDELRYSWSMDDQEIATGENPTVELGPDVHTIELIVNDGMVDSEPDYVEITVEDTTPPVITCPADVTVECDQLTDPANTGTATAIDNCDDSPGITYSDSVSGSCPMIITRIWTADDESDNASFCVQTITVQDTTGPVIAGVPADVTVECDSVPAPANLTATDNCDPGVPVIFNETRIDGDCPDSYTLTRTWTATDDCGNTTTETQIITVQDTPPPVITCPSDVVLECPADTSVEANGSATATDNCDDSVEITYEDEVIPGVGNNKTVIRVWTATDECGNSSSCEQIIVVEDTIAPELSVSVEPAVLWPVNHKMVEVLPAVSVSDGCDDDVDVTVSVTSDEDDNGKGDGNTSEDIEVTDAGRIFLRAERNGKGDGRVYTITYEAEDASGNTTQATATVTVPHDRGKSKK